jgi:hypothetical protein
MTKVPVIVSDVASQHDCIRRELSPMLMPCRGASKTGMVRFPEMMLVMDNRACHALGS